MRHLIRAPYVAVIGATALILGTTWLTPLGAETESGPPSLKEIIEKRSKVSESERAAGCLQAPACAEDPAAGQVRG